MKYQDIFVFGQNLKELWPNKVHVINLKYETNRPAKNISVALAHEIGWLTPNRLRSIL